MTSEAIFIGINGYQHFQHLKYAQQNVAVSGIKGMINIKPSMQVLKYQMLIQWSDEDNCFLVAFPDFPGLKWRTHGNTYQEAAENGIEALESLTVAYTATNEPLPQPAVCKHDRSIDYSFSFQIYLSNELRTNKKIGSTAKK